MPPARRVLLSCVALGSLSEKCSGGAAISAQKSIELILARQLASCLAMPVGIVDAEGTLVYYNEQAEEVLDQRFDETGDMKASDVMEENAGVLRAASVDIRSLDVETGRIIGLS